MLDNNNHNNSVCAFAEQSVSYLYGEAGDQEKTVFETHLKSCRNCADEFAAFGAVHSSVIEWRNEEFMSLETPLIEIPYKNAWEIYNLDNNSIASRAWIEELRRFFTQSPVLTASASFALIVFCIAIVFFAAKSSNNDKIADGNNKIVEQEFASPIVKENLPDGKSIAASSVGVDNDRQIISEPKVSQKGLIVKAAVAARNSIKDSNQTGSARIIKTVNTASKTATFARAGKVPRLNDVEEEEDKSLRLAELLGDGDTE